MELQSNRKIWTTSGVKSILEGNIFYSRTKFSFKFHIRILAADSCLEHSF